MALVISCFTQSVKSQNGSNPIPQFRNSKKCVYIRRLALWEQNTLQCFHLSPALEAFPILSASCLVRLCFTVCPIPCLVSDLVYNLVGDSKVSFRGLTFTWTLTWPRNSLFLRYWRFLMSPTGYRCLCISARMRASNGAIGRCVRVFQLFAVFQFSRYRRDSIK